MLKGVLRRNRRRYGRNRRLAKDLEAAVRMLIAIGYLAVVQSKSLWSGSGVLWVHASMMLHSLLMLCSLEICCSTRRFRLSWG